MSFAKQIKSFLEHCKRLLQQSISLCKTAEGTFWNQNTYIYLHTNVLQNLCIFCMSVLTSITQNWVIKVGTDITSHRAKTSCMHIKKVKGS
jgi:uncharacterized membrane protein